MKLGTGGHGHRIVDPCPSRRSRPVAEALVVALALAFTGAIASAQDVETDPLQCWWRTSAGAVRAGEPFTAVLTCAVLETDAVKVVVDESKLEPSVVQFAPFETLGGTHAIDLRNGDRRFFQYEYRLRLLAENLFGKDAALPETKLTYRVQSRVGQRRTTPGGPEEAIAGRDQTYVLPPLSVRLQSLVPADASDIRDASAETFAQIDQLTFRASLLTVVGGVLFALASLVALLTIVRLFVRARRPAVGSDRLVGDAAILRRVGRELGAVQREREAGGWTAALAARALAALRIVGTYALGRDPVRHDPSRQPAFTGQQPLVPAQPSPAGGGALDGGALIVTAGWLRPKPIAVSGSVTPRSVANAIARPSANGHSGNLDPLEAALSRFTVAQYGRPAGEEAALDAAALDESLATGRQILKRVRFEHTWIMKRLRRRRASSPIETRVWSR
jgi:hypothetical protein